MKKNLQYTALLSLLIASPCHAVSWEKAWTHVASFTGGAKHSLSPLLAAFSISVGAAVLIAAREGKPGPHDNDKYTLYICGGTLVLAPLFYIGRAALTGYQAA
jgi:hypothetical protein